LIEFAPINVNLLAVKCDPITFASAAIGYYAVHVCANDLAVTGATPRFYLPTILLPAGQTDDELATLIFKQIGDACRQLEIVIAGGHSEITPAVNQPVIAGTMLGEVRKDRYVSTGGCQPGDILLLAGAAPIEGTSIIAREKRSELLNRGWSQQELDSAADYLYTPGISVLRPALTAAQQGLVTAMHDPTEGGVASALLEVSRAANVGLLVDLDAIPISPLSRRLCAEFKLDPLGVIASGALLAAARPEHVQSLIQCWSEIGWSSTTVGRITRHQEGLIARRQGVQVEFPRFERDEIAKLFS
jgi:hydrogenase maturation factor